MMIDLDQSKQQQIDLRISISKLLHPIVSPYDLSETNMKANYYNNPTFYNAVEKIAAFIESKLDS